MSLKIGKDSQGLIEIRIEGTLCFDELKAAQESAEQMLRTHAKVNCLILAVGFRGWAKDGDWGDLTFMYESDPSIGKIAVVADKRWKDDLLMFLGEGRRQARVKYFDPREEQKARNWLLEADR